MSDAKRDSTGHATTTPAIYVVSMPTRRAQMVRRMSDQRLQHRLIDGVSIDDPRIDARAPDEARPYDRRVVACLIAHLDALRAFVATGAPEAIVCEDDVMLVQNFADRFDALRVDIPDQTPVVGLGYLIWHWVDHSWAGRAPQKENLCTIGQHAWGTQMYWLRRSWALACLRRFDRRISTIDTHDCRTAELIIRTPDALLAYPPLAIEDLSGSLICPDEGNRNHPEALARWDRANYAE